MCIHKFVYVYIHVYIYMCVCIEREREREREKDRKREKRERFILRNWVTQLWKLASPKYADRVAPPISVETQGRSDVAESKGNVEAELSWGCQSLFLLRPSIDWVRPTHIAEGNLLFSRSTDLNVKSY